jgi:hypothetical protein
VEYAVYIAVPIGDDAARIASAAGSLPPRGFGFRIREKSDPSEAAAAELFFRIKGVEHAEEALARALEVYGAGRAKAGLPPDEVAEPSLVPVAGSWV